MYYQFWFRLIMSRLQQRFTPLVPLITSILQRYDSKRDLQRAVFEQRINLAIIEKGTIACLSDFKNSIQASFSRKDQFIANPFNKMNSDFYTVVGKSWISLNAATKYLQEPKDFPTPYEPQFHFKAHYKQYLDDRPTLNYRCECEMITIYSWSIKVVNIAQTGYYGIILHVLDSKRKNEKILQNLANISSILYEPEIQLKMQSFRLIDLRKKCKEAKDEKVPYSLFYYLKQSELHSKAKKRPNNIMVVDTAQKFISHNKDEPTKFVSFGLIEGIGCLQYPMKTAEINLQKIQALHTQNIEIFFNYLNEKTDKKKEPVANEPRLWSSESEAEEEDPNIDDSNRKHSFHSSEEDNESESSNEDPLRKIYIKKFASLKIE